MKDTDKILKSLNNCNFFNNFNLAERYQIAELAEIKKYEAGEDIFTIDHKGKNFFLVRSGKLLLKLKTRQTKEYSRGEIFGEIAVFSENHRTGSIKALENSELISFDKEKILNQEYLQQSTILKLVINLTKIIIGYFYENEGLSSLEIIKRGESHCIEFKESMNLNINSFNDKIVRTLSAFMNLSGGTILIGIKDNGEIVGINKSNQDVDTFIRAIIQLVKDRLGDFFTSLLNFDIEEISNRIILRIDCDRSSSPVFYRGKDKYGEEKEQFIIRTGTCNTTLEKTSEIIKYVQENFKS